MGSLTFTHVGTAADGPAATIVVGSLPVWPENVFNVTLSWDQAQPGSMWLDVLARTGTAGSNWWDTTFFPGSAPGSITNSVTITVAGPYAWDTLIIVVNHFGSALVVGCTYTIVIDGVTVGPGDPPCKYGVQKQQPINSIVQVGWSLLDELGIAKLGWWAVPVILAHAGSEIYLDHLCSGNPPPATTVAAADWTTPQANNPLPVAYSKILDNFQNTVWHQFCQCSPATGGGATPVQPTIVNWTAPTYIVGPNTVSITETSLSETINNLYQYMLSLQVNNTNTTSQVAKAANCCAPPYAFGTSHPNLSGTGNLVIGDIVGVLVQITARPDPGRQLEGQPPYLWNQAWVSLQTVDGMLDELRITRDAMVWIPPIAPLAHRLGYYTWPGVTITIIELVEAAS